MRHGTACSLLANINRDSHQRPEPYQSADFIYWGPSTEPASAQAPVLLADPVAQSKLMRAALFGVNPTP